MCYNQTGDISTLDGTPLKLVDKFTYLGSSVASTEKDIDTRLTKAWTAINRLSIIWKSDLTDKMKRSFFQAAVTSILLDGCTTWTLTKRLEKKLDGKYTRMLRAILNKSWRQHPTRHQLYGHLSPITKTIQVRRTRHAGDCWRSKDELISDILLWTSTHGRAKAGRPARTYIQQLCEDTGCCPEDLPGAMNDREKWRQRVRDIRATSTTWWWWWWDDGQKRVMRWRTKKSYQMTDKKELRDDGQKKRVMRWRTRKLLDDRQKRVMRWPTKKRVMRWRTKKSYEMTDKKELRDDGQKRVIWWQTKKSYEMTDKKELRDDGQKKNWWLLVIYSFYHPHIDQRIWNIRTQNPIFCLFVCFLLHIGSDVDIWHWYKICSYPNQCLLVQEIDWNEPAFNEEGLCNLETFQQQNTIFLHYYHHGYVFSPAMEQEHACRIRNFGGEW